jgi:hypothetical protein
VTLENVPRRLDTSAEQTWTTGTGSPKWKSQGTTAAADWLEIAGGFPSTAVVRMPSLAFAPTLPDSVSEVGSFVSYLYGVSDREGHEI